MHEQFTLVLADDGRFQWHTADRVLPFIAGGDGDVPADSDTIEVPEDLTTVEDLAPLSDSLTAALDALRARAESDPASITADDAALAATYAEALAAVAAEQGKRDGEQADRVSAVLDATASTTEPDPDEGTEGEGEDAPEQPAEAPAEGEPAEAVAEAAAEPVAASARRGAVRVPAVAKRGTINPSLRGIAQRQPASTEAGRLAAGSGLLPGQSSLAPDLVVTAAGQFGRVNNGDRYARLDDLADAFVARCQSMGITQGQGNPLPVATIQRHFSEVVGADASDEEIGDALDRLLHGYGDPRSRAGMEALTAAGGWCAPSEIRYDFFNVAQVSGQVDLPTLGINRGGLRWPISLDLADFFALSGGAASGIPTNASMPWVWTETDDQLAATGSPTKSCLRPPCPTFDEARLIAYGLCVLAGNLTEDAYPELIRHFIALTTVAHARAMNRKHIATMEAHSSVTSTTPTLGGSSSLTTHLLGAADLIATHLRTKYGAAQDAVVEYLLPVFIPGAVRSDLAKRNGWDDLSVTSAWLASQFDARNIRVQIVEDWQVLPGSTGTQLGGATVPATWPAAFNGLMYFPGHFFRGNGLNLTLGALRDSVLNESNDHTAAWSEEATLIGARGPEAYKIVHTSQVAGGTTASQVAATASA
jgi:hypothetical protein